jgi:hypothetical protein
MIFAYLITAIAKPTRSKAFSVLIRGAMLLNFLRP